MVAVVGLFSRVLQKDFFSTQVGGSALFSSSSITLSGVNIEGFPSSLS
jgi:hypothetical protein